MASSMREVVTLQFGDFSNFIGAHFWSIEDELVVFADDGAILQGPADDGATGDEEKLSQLQNVEIAPESCLRNTRSANSKTETFAVPRLVSFGLTGSLGTVSSAGTINPDAVHPTQRPDLPSTWTGAVRLTRQERVEKNPFLLFLEQEDAGLAPNLPVSGAVAHHSGSEDASEDEDDPDVRYASEDEDEAEDEQGLSRHTPAGGKHKARKHAAKRIGREENAERKADEELVDFGLDNTVKYWTDFCKVHFDRGTLVEVSGLHHGVSEFDWFAQGVEQWRRQDTAEEMSDALRKAVEQCDHLQGLRCVVDVDNAWGGLASMFLEETRDDFPVTPIACYGVASPLPLYSASDALKHKQRRAFNALLSQNSLSESCSYYVPLTSDHWDESHMGRGVLLDSRRPFHTSAILGAALHTVSAPYRLTDAPLTMAHMCSTLVPLPRVKVLSLQYGMPLDDARLDQQLQIFAPWSKQEQQESHTRGRSQAAPAQPDISTPEAPLPLYRTRLMSDMSSPFAAPRGPSSQAQKARPAWAEHAMDSESDSDEERETGEKTIGEFNVLRGARVCDTAGLRSRFQKLRESKGRGKLSAAEEQDERDFLCWEPFLRLVDSHRAISSGSAPMKNPVPIPLSFPKVFVGDSHKPRELPHASAMSELFSSTAMHAVWTERAKALKVLSVGQQRGRVQDSLQSVKLQVEDLVDALGELSEEYRTAATSSLL